MSVANAVAKELDDPPLWVERQQYRHNRTEPLAAMSRRLPLWFAATCLVGALCQPDVQATVRHLQETAEAVEHDLIAVRSQPRPARPVAAQVLDDEPKLEPAAAALVERVVATMAAGKTGDGVSDAATVRVLPSKEPVAAKVAVRSNPASNQPLVPANGRLADSYVVPAQRALVRHISSIWRVPEPQIQRYVGKVWRTAGELEVDPFLVLAVMATESSFNHRAQSSRGAQGLMQVHTRVHQEKFKPHGGAKRAFEPEASIKVGSQILKQYLDRYGSPRGALKAYVGAANLKSDGGYANKVLKRHAEFKQVVRTELTRLSAAGKLKPAGRVSSVGSADGKTPTRVAASSVNPGSTTR